MCVFASLRRIALPVLWWGLLLLWALPAHGHRVMIFAWVEGATIHTESSFGGGSPVRGGTIEVYDDQAVKRLTGTTDDEGRFSFPIDFPVNGDLKVVVVAGMGHMGHWIVRADEMAATPGNGAVRPVAQTESDTETGARDDAVGSGDGGVGPCLDAKTVERIVQQVLESRLGPLEARLAAQNAPWRDIVAGIGYIFGLVGVATYVRYHRKEGR
jgi:nickel transport protein